MHTQPDIVATLQVSATTLRLADVEGFEIGITAFNHSARKQPTGLSAYQLMVNGESSFAFRLAIWNGHKSTKWTDLPAGDAVGMSWQHMGPALFPEAGEYLLELKTPFGGVDTAKVVVTE